MRTNSFKKIILVLIGGLLIIPGLVWADSGEELAEMISTVFNFAISLVGIICFVILIIGGLGYLTAGGSPIAMARARKRIISGLSGIALILSSQLILTTINPDLARSIFELPGIDEPTEWQPNDRPGPPNITYTYQEIPFGTILETKILAKNIGCGELDCYTQEELTIQELEDIAAQMVRVAPEAWPEATIEDAEIAYLCYDFDDEGNFIEREGNIESMVNNDRLDCIERIAEAIQAKSETLNTRVQEIRRLTISGCQCNRCACGACRECPEPGVDCDDDPDCDCDPDAPCEPEPCPPNDPECEPEPCPPCLPCCEPCEPCDTCNCSDACMGERDVVCPSASEIDKIRWGDLWMDQIIEGYELLDESQLVQVPVERFQEMTLVNQIRYLSSRFLPPHIASLTVDLNYLEKASKMYKEECGYGNQLSQATLMQIIEEKGSSDLINIEINPFCLNSAPASWGETCSEEEQVSIDQWCHEFNCTDCDEEGADKLPCGQCDLDQTETGIEVVYPVGEENKSTYKCSRYRVNQQDGLEDREIDDELGILCRIQSNGEICESLTGNPFTFYCPQEFSSAPSTTEEQMMVSEFTINQLYQNGYQQGHIEVGQLVDNAQAYLERIIEPLKSIVQREATDITCPSFDKKDPDNLCQLFSASERCTCQGIMRTEYEAEGDCGKSCNVQHGCLCSICEEPCEGCNCSTCWPLELELEDYDQHPCPRSIIESRVSETQAAYMSINNHVNNIISLVLAQGLAPNQPNRAELFNQLQDTEKKLRRCISGFSVSGYLTSTIARPMDCRYLLDMQQLGLGEGIKVSPPVEMCYPYNSESTYGNGLSNGQRAACQADRNSRECLRAIDDLMFDYFCLEEAMN